MDTREELLKQLLAAQNTIEKLVKENCKLKEEKEFLRNLITDNLEFQMNSFKYTKRFIKKEEENGCTDKD